MTQEQQWEVQEILQRGRFNGLTHYLIKWKGYKIQESTWEPITNLEQCPQAIADFECKIRLTNQQKPKNTKEKKKAVSHGGAQGQDYVGSREKIGKDTIEIQQISNKSRINTRMMSKKTSKIPQTGNQGEQWVFDGQEGNQVVKQQGDNMVDHNSKKRSLEQVIPHGQNLGIKQQQEVVSKKRKPNQVSEEQRERPIEPQQQPKNTQVANKSNQEKSNSKSVQSDRTQPEKLQPFKDVSSDKKVNENKKMNEIPQISVSEPQKQPSINQNTEKNIQETPLLLQNASRYRLCDNILKKSKILALKNIVRRRQGQPSIKQSIKVLDLSFQQEILKELGSIQTAKQQKMLLVIEMLIKVEYGWMALGRQNKQSPAILVDVNLILPQIWNALISRVSPQ